jgi:hypothetical protein
MSAEPVKLFGLLKRRSDRTLAQFAHHWRTRHRDLSLLLIAPGIMDGYVQNHRMMEGGEIPGLTLAGDGFPELWTYGYDLLARLATAREYLEGAYLDEPNLMGGRPEALLATEHVIDDGIGRLAGALQIKAMIFFRRAQGMARERFNAEVLRPRRPLLLSDAGSTPTRLTRHLSIELPGKDTDKTYEAVQNYDAIEASYWPDAAAFHAAWAGRSKDPGWIDPAATVGVLVREEPVLLTHYPSPGL